jgi:hypothetical protein
LGGPLAHGSAALTLVISTEAQRSGEICGFLPAKEKSAIPDQVSRPHF